MNFESVPFELFCSCSRACPLNGWLSLNKRGLIFTSLTRWRTADRTLLIRCSWCCLIARWIRLGSSSSTSTRIRMSWLKSAFSHTHIHTLLFITRRWICIRDTQSKIRAREPKPYCKLVGFRSRLYRIRFFASKCSFSSNTRFAYFKVLNCSEPSPSRRRIRSRGRGTRNWIC